MKRILWLIAWIVSASVAFAAPPSIPPNAPGAAFTAAGGTNAVSASTRAGWTLTPMDFNASAGTGGDDSTAINAAISAIDSGPSSAGRLLLPPPPSGYYNVCAAPVTIPGDALALTIDGGNGNVNAARGTIIRILPACASPPSSVLYVPSNYWGQLSLQKVTLDAWCLAAHDLDDEHSVHFTSRDVVYRNAATGGSNIYIASGYENNIGESNYAENVNDYGHVCYSSASAMPNYNLDDTASDSNFDGLIGVDAYVANFILRSGNLHMARSHGWGYPSDPVASVDLRAQYTYETYYWTSLVDCFADNFKTAAIAVHGDGANIIGCGTVAPATGASGVVIDSGLKNVVVIGNHFDSLGNTALGVVQNGTADPSTIVFGNTGASYQALDQSPWTINAPLNFANGVLSFTWPSSAPISTIAPTGAVSSINPTTYQYATTYTPAAWNNALPTITINAPPTGGTQATASVVSMDYVTPGTIVSGGANCQAGDILTLVGGTVVSGANTAGISLTSVSGGVATAVAWHGPMPVRYSAFPSDSTSVSWTGGHCTSNVTTHGISWSPDNAADYSVTAGGSGYTSTPTVTFPETGGAFPTSTANLTNNLTLTAASGYMQMNGSGTVLGVPGTSGNPIVTQAALVDATGVRQTLTTSGYTVPANVDLVRFIQGSTVSSATVTLPTAFADGQPIQFVNYAGAVTALTFSPSVNGWTNGSTLAANAGLRVRWDATAAAWYREQ